MLSLSDVSRDMIHEPFSVFNHMQLLINNPIYYSPPLHTNCCCKVSYINQNSCWNQQKSSPVYLKFYKKEGFILVYIAKMLGGRFRYQLVQGFDRFSQNFFLRLASWVCGVCVCAWGSGKSVKGVSVYLQILSSVLINNGFRTLMKNEFSVWFWSKKGKDISSTWRRA